MSGPNYVILKPVNKASFCFISEVIQWRAFGTFPESYWNNDGTVSPSMAPRSLMFGSEKLGRFMGNMSTFYCTLHPPNMFV